MVWFPSYWEIGYYLRMSKLIQPLKITWQMPDPPVEPKSWSKVEPGPRSTGSEILGHRLGIGPSGLDCLDAAFKKKLNRFTGWELDAPDHFKAAQIFKRGVHWRYGNTTCPVAVKSGSYQISFASSEADLSQRLSNYKDWSVLFDEKVGDAWPDLCDRLNAECFTTNEINKNLMTVAEILEEIEGAPGVVIVGGGILGDMAGFAASLANIPMVLVPTTLLAMADACVGGKTGVNYPPHGKNQIGTFYFPQEVIVWDGWLQTLDQRQLNAGKAECLKHMFLAGDLETGECIASGDFAPYLADIIKVKANVVSADPAEQGLRAILNFGHTLAHALEAYSHEHVGPDEIILHGEAVAVGMAFALLLSHAEGHLQRKDMRRMGQILLDAKILPSLEELSSMLGANISDQDLWTSIEGLIAKDKKSTGDDHSSNWILLKKPGEAVPGELNNFLNPVGPEKLKAVWQTLLATL